MSGERRNFSPVEKIAVLKKHLVDKVPVSEVCGKHSIHVNIFYRWQVELFENGHKAFEKPSKCLGEQEKKLSGLRDKLARKDEVIVELMDDYVSLKKKLGVN